MGWKKRNDDFSPDDWPSILGLKRAVFMHATVELGSVDGVLYPYSAFSVAALSLVLTNPMKVDDRGTATGKYIMEPVRNNFVDVGGRVTLPRYTSDDIVDRLRAETEMMLKIGFASGLYSVAFYVPRLVFTEEDISTPGPEVRQPQFSFKAYKPEPLTDITNPFKVPNGGTGEWYADLEGIPIVKNNPLVVMTVNDEDVNLLLEN